METPELHNFDHMPRVAHQIANAITPKFPLANKPSAMELSDAADGTSFWRLAKMLFRDQLPRYDR